MAALALFPSYSEWYQSIRSLICVRPCTDAWWAEPRELYPSTGICDCRCGRSVRSAGSRKLTPSVCLGVAG